jgi:hypothetical protein
MVISLTGWCILYWRVPRILDLSEAWGFDPKKAELQPFRRVLLSLVPAFSPASKHRRDVVGIRGIVLDVFRLYV